MTNSILVRQVAQSASRRVLFMMAGALLPFAASEDVCAQAWPARTITTIVPFAAGSASDVLPRIVLDQVSKQLGRTIIVENRAGAGGILGSGMVAKAAPDGYTVLASAALATTHSLHPKLPYDTLADFVPVAALGQQPMVLVTSPSKPFKTLRQLVSTAKARPGELNFATAGIGSASHFATERLKLSARFEAQQIPFKGATEGLTEVLAGRVDFFFVPVAPALSLINDGRLLALAVSTPNRTTALPQVPTTIEAGFVGSAYELWVGLFLPSRTPRQIVDRLHGETVAALETSSVQGRLAKLGVDPMPMSLERVASYFNEDVAATAGLVKLAKIRLP